MKYRLSGWVNIAGQGTLDPKIRDAISNRLIATKDLPDYKTDWRQRGPQFSSRYQRFIEEFNFRPPNFLTDLYQSNKDDSEQ